YEVATVIEHVYRESMNNNPKGTGFGAAVGNIGFFRPPATSNMNLDYKGEARPVALSVGVDDRTNSLALQCNTAMYEDVKKLVDHMEKAAADSPQTVRVVSISGIDPVLVEQAINAIQGV